MDWFRRNWPDLLIGIALVAVIAGIIATLITGGSFFPVGQNASRTPPPGQSSSVTPGTTVPGATAPGSSQPAAPTTGGPDATTTPSGSGNGSGTPSAAAPSTTGSAATPSASPGISVLPPTDTVSPAAGATPAAAAPAASSSTPAAAATPSASPTTTSSTSAGNAGTSIDSGPGSDAPYRISVGAFGQLSNAQAQEAAFRAAGYPVFLAEQGDLNIVLVGPYVSEAAAEAAADKIRAGGFGVDPVIYRFRGDDDSAPAAATASSPTPTAAASSAPAPAQAVPSSTTGRYIQVGAYGSAASAKPQSDRMAAMGYRVTERTEGSLIKLLIGPFDGARVGEVKAQLDAAGIESFVR